jgi:hypothetical protein
MEKAILVKVNESCPHIIESKLGLGLVKSAQHKLLFYSGYSPEWY